MWIRSVLVLVPLTVLAPEVHGSPAANVMRKIVERIRPDAVFGEPRQQAAEGTKSRRKRFVPLPNGRNGLTQEEIEIIVAAHNDYRGGVEPTASNMRFMVSHREHSTG